MEKKMKKWPQRIRPSVVTARYDCKKLFYFIYSGGPFLMLNQTDLLTGNKNTTFAAVQKAFFYSQNHPT